MPYNPKKDYYEMIDGISPSSNLKEIKKSYRKKVLVYHPDKNPGKEEWAKNKFLELKEIYEIIIDPEKRLMYDKEREKFFSLKKQIDYGMEIHLQTECSIFTFQFKYQNFC